MAVDKISHKIAANHFRIISFSINFVFKFERNAIAAGVFMYVKIMTSTYGCTRRIFLNK